jgi:hypothetical protein
MKKFKEITAHIICSIVLLVGFITIWVEPYYLFNLGWVPRVTYALLLLFTVITTINEFGWWKFIYPCVTGLVPLADIGTFYSAGNGTETAYLHFVLGSSFNFPYVLISYLLFIAVLPCCAIWVSTFFIKRHHSLTSAIQ